jgi:hypothetical protein
VPRLSAGAAVLLLGIAALLAGCARKTAGTTGDHTPPSATPIADVLAAHQQELLALPGVVGIGVGQCRGVPCIVVMAAVASPELSRRLPSSLEGHPVELRVTGPITARPR